MFVAFLLKLILLKLNQLSIRTEIKRETFTNKICEEIKMIKFPSKFHRLLTYVKSLDEKINLCSKKVILFY